MVNLRKSTKCGDFTLITVTFRLMAKCRTSAERPLGTGFELMRIMIIASAIPKRLLIMASFSKSLPLKMVEQPRRMLGGCNL